MNNVNPFKILVLLFFAASLFSQCTGINKKAGNFQAWEQSIEIRAFPNAFSREQDNRIINIEALSGEYASAQVVAKSTSDIKALSGKISELTSSGSTIPSASARVRYATTLPVDETQMLTPDPLLEVNSIDIPANLAQALWITIKVPSGADPGIYKGKLNISAASGEKTTFDLNLEVLPAIMPEPGEWEYYLNIWQDVSGIAEAHKVEYWSEEHWALIEKYADNFAEHGLDAITAIIVHDPWGSQAGYPVRAMVQWKYPGEYVKGSPGKLEWDFTVFDRFVNTMFKAGLGQKIDCFSMVEGPWINMNADIQYLDSQSGEDKLLDLELGDPVWKEVWAAFLPVFEKHLKEKGWFEKTYLGFDEKPEDAMDMIFDFSSKNGPGFKIGVAGGFPGDEKKFPHASVLHINELTNREHLKESRKLIKRMRENNRYISFYTACQPHHPNFFLYSSLRESRLLPWLAVKHNLSGYLRWAVCTFPENVWEQPNYKWHSGDMYFVYPGEDGPLDGMRWEVLRQGVQDCEAYRIALEMCTKKDNKELLRKLRRALSLGSTIESCSQTPWIKDGRKIVNDVLRELGN